MTALMKRLKAFELTMNNRIILTVPPKIEFTSIVENFVDVILPHFKMDKTGTTAQELRSILNEAFVNVIDHTSTELSEQVEFIFVLDTPRLIIHILDRGKGIAIDNFHPPYPGSLINASRPVLKTMDGEVIAQVIDQNTLEMSFRELDIENMSQEHLLDNVDEGGMGLSLIIKLMDKVRFKFTKESGNCLEITKNFK